MPCDFWKVFKFGDHVLCTVELTAAHSSAVLYCQLESIKGTRYNIEYEWSAQCLSYINCQIMLKCIIDDMTYIITIIIMLKISLDFRISAAKTRPASL